jgi:hypothetical protein
VRALGALALLAAPVLAQDVPFNASLVSRLDVASSYADVWGEGNVAIMGRFGQNRVDLIDITNPAAPIVASTYVVNSPDTGASAQDVKSANGLMFVGLESSSGNGAHIVDIRDPYNPVLLTKVDPEPGPYEAVHNLFYDNGYLYMVGGNDVAIVDLTNYDINNPPATIGSWAHRITNMAGPFCHDITVVNGKLYGAVWDNLEVYDVSSLATTPPVLVDRVPGVSCHAVWATPDNRWVVTTEERAGGSVRLYEDVGTGGATQLIQRDSYTVSPARALGVHNVVIDDDRVYLSYYQAGVHVLQIDRTEKRLELISSYDTSTSSTGGFAGCWGVYPFLGANKVLASDMQNGLYVLDMDPLSFVFPNGKPLISDPTGSTQVDVQVTEGFDAVDPASVTLHVSVDGGPDMPLAMASTGGGGFQAALPAAACGSRLAWSVSASNTGGTSYSSQTASSVVAGGVTSVFSDDFETDQGWTVQDTAVSTGTWTRVDPNGSGGADEYDASDSGTRCYVTGQGPVSGSAGTADMDGGPTRLLSPLLDFSGGDGQISYTRWFFNDDLDNDNLLVEVSNDGGSSWKTVQNVTAHAGGWVEERFVLSDYWPPTANVRVRFSVSDNPNDSITEGGLDDFEAELFDCSTAGGPTLTATPIVRGQVSLFTVSNANPGEAVIFVLSVNGVGAGPCFMGGALCLDILDPLINLGNAVVGGTGLADLPFLVPAGVPTIPVWLQAVTIGGTATTTNVVSQTIQ